MNILGIETSCDETAAAIVEDGTRVLGASLATSSELHQITGGVVPEVAARKQVEYIVPVIADCLKNANLSPTNIDAVAVTYGPGLIGSLLVGVSAAQALALAWNKPLIPVNHLIGHIYANFVDSTSLRELPCVAMVVSGGHTDIVLMKEHGDFQYIGGTLDDAAGEAFDKTARLLGIQKYLGGAALSKVASTCSVADNVIAGELPRPKIDDADYDFSFSGLKSAVKRLVETEKYPTEVVALEFETAVVDVLVAKVIKAAQDYKVSTILLGGGVSANRTLRARLSKECDALHIALHVPSISLCADTAVNIAAAAYFVNSKNMTQDLRIEADPSLAITTV